MSVGAKDLPEDQEIELIRIAIYFVFKLFQQGRGESAFAGEEERAVFFGEEVVEAGTVKAQGDLFRRERAFKDCKQAGAFGLEGDGDELAAREGFEDPFESGARNVRGVGEVVVADRACAFPFAEVPEPQVDSLFRWGQVGEDRVEKRGEFHD